MRCDKLLFQKSEEQEFCLNAASSMQVFMEAIIFLAKKIVAMFGMDDIPSYRTEESKFVVQNC